MPLLSLKGIAYKYIKDKILSCEIRGGERLREDVLAEELEMSRTPVREAINQLVMEGLVQSMPRKGLYCVEITDADINDLCDIRNIYEIYAIKQCVDICTDEQINQMEKLAIQYRVACENNQPLCDYDDGFHEKIIHLSGNRHLISTYSKIYNHLHILRVMTGKSMYKEINAKTSSDQHILTVECIRNRDKALAVATAEDHIEKMRRALHQSGI